jgi:GAF domain-containing protein
VDQYPDGFAALVVALNASMVDEEDLDETLRRVAFIACQSPIGADNAGVTLQRGDAAATAAFHGDAALPLDQAQYEADDGPCLTAFRTGEVVRVERIADAGARWPKFVAAAAEAGIVSSLSLPLVLKSEIVGALNLYASQHLSFTDTSVHLARLFAEQAALAVTNAEIYWKTYTLTQNLTLALENRERIGQANGILATRLGITMDEAFDQLRRASQNLNIKLRDIADHVVETGDLPGSPAPSA